MRLISYFRTKLQQNRAFTLVEMSIVIVIISLILALVVKGNVVVESAKLRTVISEISSNKTAVNSFYAKYSALPGDFNEATSYWSNAEVKNGNGDGKISFQNSESVYEGYNAWQHLSNEHMLDQNFLGTATNNIAQLNIDIPKARVGGGYFFDSALISDSPDANVIALGVPTSTNSAVIPNIISFDPGLLPNQAYEIDNKMDDGNPTTGMVRGQDGKTHGTCIDANNQYFISSKVIGCKIVFKISAQ